MGFTERSLFGSRPDHAYTPEHGLDKLEKDLDEAEKRFESARSYAQEISSQLALWKKFLEESDATLANPEAAQLIKHTIRLHDLYRKASRDFRAAEKDLEALEEAHEAILDTNVFGSSEIGEA